MFATHSAVSRRHERKYATRIAGTKYSNRSCELSRHIYSIHAHTHTEQNRDQPIHLGNYLSPESARVLQVVYVRHSLFTPHITDSLCSTASTRDAGSRVVCMYLYNIYTCPRHE